MGSAGQRRGLALFARASADLNSKIPKRITSKHNQKPLAQVLLPADSPRLCEDMGERLADVLVDHMAHDYGHYGLLVHRSHQHQIPQKDRV
ncbi:partitioning defective 3 [Babesia ovata]|uniref:Partitioning defective 3 n=1 Tax=Babesia ovata TaxID=189622 RepID=A0A2H6K9X9_9APIC|nr:partitioning defective 3 [Babesia ovata]GBE59801.1 partitioning defective 3 [Babesia ovata]